MLYHKINAPFKRHLDGPNKGRLIIGDWALPEFEYLAKCPWEFTEKVDGTNIRIRIEWDHFLGFPVLNIGGRTWNSDIPGPLMDHLVATFGTPGNSDTAHPHPRWWEAFKDTAGVVTLYGEGYGPKINGGGKYRDDCSFVLFDVFVGDLWWLDRDNVNDVAAKMGIDAVPVIGKGTLFDAIDIVRTDVDQRLYVSAQTGLWVKGKKPLISQWGDFEAEGIVARPTVPLFNRKGERVITKIKAVDFR
jgi:hypothetical protein